MKIILSFFILFLFTFPAVNAQISGSVTGKIVSFSSQLNIENAEVSIVKTVFKSISNKEGEFLIKNLPLGKYKLQIIAKNFSTKTVLFELTTNNFQLNFGSVFLDDIKADPQEESLVYLNNDDLMLFDNAESQSISGILNASKNIFYKTVAYEFSPTFFRPRNLDAAYSTVMINALKMNKMYNNRPQWSNWGGLNDAVRNQNFLSNSTPSDLGFGSIGGISNINTRSTAYRAGLKVSYAASNRSYIGRVMATYHTGLLANGWAFSIAGSYRFAQEGFRQGTPYKASSFFSSVEKQLSTKHSLNFTAVYASNIRGKSSPNTKEVYNLKEIDYNAYWGKQDKIIRNARMRNIEEPILQLGHYFNISSKSNLQTTISYQFGEIGNSRLDYGGTRLISNGENTPTIIGGGVNPDPTYYQKLPSYFLRDANQPDYEGAYLAEQEFLDNGQVDWDALYEANQNNFREEKHSVYALYEDRNDDKQLSISSILNLEISEKIILNAGVHYRNLESENFAYMLDLLGGDGFLDVDVYADNIHDAQNDLQNPNRIIKQHDKFKYHFNLTGSSIEGFTTLKYQSKKLDAYLGISYNQSNYQREGFYENGYYPGKESLGKSNKLSFHDLGYKSGLTYKLSGRHILNTNLAYASQAPTLQNSFSNVRESNAVVQDLQSEKLLLADLEYVLRHPKLNAKIGAYWINLKDKTEISFYFADGLVGLENAENTAFVQEVLTGVNQQHFGLEFAMEVPILPILKFKSVAAIGQATYNQNPNLYLTSDAFKGVLDYGEVSLKNYFVASGPQQAYSVGFEYNSPKYWWLGVTGNYFKNAFVDIAPITRTKNFFLDNDGLPINDYDENIAKELLQQEQFEPYYLINIVGGKSWKVKDYYFGFFANVSNILNTKYKTGGFEQSRNANYNTLLEDRTRQKPLFGNKYWYGYGTTYYVSVYLRI